MKILRLLSLLLALSLLCTAAMAETDLSALSEDQLRQFLRDVQLELATRTPADGVLATWETDSARISLLSIARGKSYEGGSGLLFTLSYTNLSQQTATFREQHWITVYQHGVELDRTIAIDGKTGFTDTWSKKVQPGATLPALLWAVALPDASDTIDVEIEYRPDFSSQSAGIHTVPLPR